MNLTECRLYSLCSGDHHQSHQIDNKVALMTDPVTGAKAVKAPDSHVCSGSDLIQLL